MSEIREHLRTFIIENFIHEAVDETFTDDADLKEAGILSSLAVLQLMTFVEEKFEVELTAQDLEFDGLFSVANIENLVRSRKK